jgi:hypothetical protein
MRRDGAAHIPAIGDSPNCVDASRGNSDDCGANKSDVANLRGAMAS